MSKNIRFKIVCISTKEDLLDAEGEIRYFENGDDAGALADKLTKLTSEKYQPRRVVTDTNWMAREAKRFYDGTYYPVPWDSENWWNNYCKDAATKHFVHVSIERDAKVAYTPNDEWGTADKQQRVGVGSYLKKFCGHYIDSDAIRDYVTQFSVQYEDIQYKLATDADKIQDVYMNGPRSCMAHPVKNYATGGIHPSRVYAGPDLAVAYLLKGEFQLCQRCEDDGHTACRNRDNPCDSFAYSARALVWPERKRHSVIYGDAQRLEAVLRRDGFKKGQLDGARLQRIPSSKDKDGLPFKVPAFVLPFIDNHNRVRDDGQFLVIDEDKGLIDCRRTDGNGVDTRAHCTSCGTLANNRNFQAVHARTANRTESICSDCQKENPIVSCRGHNVYFRRSDCIDFADWGVFSIHYLSNGYNIQICSQTNLPFNSAHGDKMVAMDDGKVVSAEWFKTSGKYCGQCGRGLLRAATGKCRGCDYPIDVAVPKVAVDVGAYGGTYTISNTASVGAQGGGRLNPTSNAVLNQALNAPGWATATPTAPPRRRR